jgi:hypothetical protein
MCHFCGVIGHMEKFCMKKFEPDYVEKEREWGHFLKVDNINTGGGVVKNKWIKYGNVAERERWKEP